MSAIIDNLRDASRTVRVNTAEKLTYIVPVVDSQPDPRQREIILAGEGAEAEVIGLFLGRGNGQLNLTINTTHAAPNTRGYTLFKAVLFDESQLEFNGMIKILKGAQGSNDFLEQNSLLMSEHAKANAVPGLEIEANDVKASHGATAGPVDPEQKFYLMSRGLSETQAERMIVQGFLAPILKALPDEKLRQSIIDSLDAQR